MADTSTSFLVTGKMLGDAGEHYALSQFTFAGRAGCKMPEGWSAYDLVVESGNGPVRVSVKTRSETAKWKKGSWFTFDERSVCEWLVFIFKTKDGAVRSWIVPFETARKFANSPSPSRKEPHLREVSWAKLMKSPLRDYENNWTLQETVVAPSHPLLS